MSSTESTTAKRSRKPDNGLGEGDTIGLTGEVTIVHDDGKATVWLKASTIR